MRLNFIGKLLPVWILEKMLHKRNAEFCIFALSKSIKGRDSRYYEIGEGLFLVYTQETYNNIQESKRKSREAESQRKKNKKLRKYEKLKEEFEK